MKKVLRLFCFFFISCAINAQTSCYTPINLDPTDITDNSANINWFPNGNTPTNGFDIYLSTGNTAPNSTTIPTISGATSVSRVITSLQPATIYKVWVRSNCSSGTSDWSFPKSFVTLCSQTLPYIQDLESTGINTLPNCSTQQYQNAPWSVKIISSGLGFTQGKVLSCNFDNISNVNAWWFTYKFNLHAGKTYSVKFKKGNENIKDAVTHRLKVAYGMSADATSMTTVIKDFTINQQLNAENEVIYFMPAISGSYYFGFNAYTPTGVIGKGTFLLDDISIDETINCSLPNDITMGSISSNTAVINWNGAIPIPGEGYDIYLNTDNTQPSASVVPNYQGILGLSQNLSSLIPGKRYYVWVRSRCSSSQVSDWRGISFSTECPTVFNIPYLENFEESIVGSIPLCSFSSGNKWSVLNNHSYSYTGGNSVNWQGKALHFNEVTDESGWFFTPGINLEVGKQYKITYQYGKGTPYAYDNLKVAYGNAQTLSAMTAILTTHVGIPVGNFYNSMLFSVNMSGIYYFGFNSYISSFGFTRALAIDNIKIEENGFLAVEDINKEKGTNVYPNPFKDVLNISDIKNIISVTISDLSGRLIKKLDTEKELNLQYLNIGTYLITLKYKDNTFKTFKVVKK